VNLLFSADTFDKNAEYSNFIRARQDKVEFSWEYLIFILFYLTYLTFFDQ